MAFLKQLIFRKVPFNNSYENVFDSKERLIRFLKGSYKQEEKHTIDFIALGKDRGFNANKKTIVTVNRDEVLGNFDFYNRFNYVIVVTGNKEDVTDDKEYLYFIVGSRIDNSGEVVTFDLEYDEWHNNIDEFMEKNSNRQQFFDRMTYDGYLKENSSYQYDGLVKDEILKTVTRKTLSDEQITIGGNNYLRLLFKKITLVEENKLYLIFENGISVNPYEAAFFGEPPLTVYYIPYAVINISTMSIVENIDKCWVNTQSGIIEFNLALMADGAFSGTNDAIFGKYLDSITQDATFTFWTPYTYSIDTVNGRVVFDKRIRTTVTIGEFRGVDDTVPYGESTYPILGRIFEGSTAETYYYDNFENYKIEQTELNGFNTQKNIIQFRDKFYPYNYKSFLVNEEEVPFIPIPSILSSRIIVTSKQRELSPKFRYFKGSDNILRKTLKPKGSLPILNPTLIDYLRNNRESINIQKICSAISGTMGLISSALTKNVVGGVSSVANTIIGMGEIDAKIKDADNALDTVTNITGNGFEDIYVQDNIYIFDNITVSPKILSSLVNYFEKYGITYEEFDTIKQNYHKFDYYKIASPDFILTDLEALNTFKNIFSNGVRVWHLGYIYPVNPDKAEAQNVFKEIVSFDYTRANIPMSIIEGEELL